MTPGPSPTHDPAYPLFGPYGEVGAAPHVPPPQQRKLMSYHAQAAIRVVTITLLLIACYWVGFHR